MHSSSARRLGALTCASIALMATNACDLGIASLGNFSIDGPVCNASCYDFTFWLLPETENILRGDSLELSVLSTKGFNKATWASSGGAIAMVLGDGSLDSTITTAQTDTWIKARRAGTGMVEARTIGGEYADTSVILVADSSSIVEMRAYINSNTPLKVNVTAYIDVVMFDANLQSFRAMPTGWTVSDTALFAVPPPTYFNGNWSRFAVVPKRTGNGTLTFTFLGVTKAVAFTIN